MFDLNTVSKAQNEQIVQNNVISSHDADILAFPCQSVTITAKAPEYENDPVERRMMLPLHSHEMDAVWGMLQHRAKHLGQDLWVATNSFLAAMDLEDLADLRRCDLVSAIKYLVASRDVPAQVQSIM